VTTAELEQVWRRCAPDLLAALIRRCATSTPLKMLYKTRYLRQPGNGPSRGCPTTPRAG
jgi:hypothetical protein